MEKLIEIGGAALLILFHLLMALLGAVIVVVSLSVFLSLLIRLARWLLG